MAEQIVEEAVLQGLAEMPFATHRELAEVLQCKPASIQSSLGPLEDAGWVQCMTAVGSRRSERWYLTRLGIEQLACALDVSLNDLLMEYPLSVQWQRSLLQRLDTLTILYRLASQIANACQGPVTWSWTRTGPIDAQITLPDARTVGITRMGQTRSWRGHRSRLGTLVTLRNLGELKACLVLTSDRIDMMRMALELDGTGNGMWLANEMDFLSGRSDAVIWQGSARHLSLPSLLDHVEAGAARYSPAVEDEGRLPRDGALLDHSALDLVAAALPQRAKDLMKSLFDWPLMTASQIAAVTGMSEPGLRRWRAALNAAGLVHSIRIGWTDTERKENGSRLCLSQDGLRYMTYQDRSRTSDVLDQWSVVPSPNGDPDLPIARYRLEGTKLRGLAEHLLHTDGVSNFIALTSLAVRHSRDWELKQATPPHRWTRSFLYGNRSHSIRPDAVLLTRFRGIEVPLLIEYERRATRPSRMESRLMVYHRYYNSGSRQPEFEGPDPAVLVVYDLREDASRYVAFCRGRLREGLPVLVSSLDILDEQNVFAETWTDPWHLETGPVSLLTATGR